MYTSRKSASGIDSSSTKESTSINVINDTVNHLVTSPKAPTTEKSSCPFSERRVTYVDYSHQPMVFEKHDFSRLQENPLSADFSAQLDCTLEPSGKWTLNLSKMKGSKITYLLGCEFREDEQLLLDSLIPESERSAHHQKVESILNQGKKSSYWEHLFTGKMRNTLKIVSPFQASPREVKIFMTPSDVVPTNGYVFNVTFVDQTVTHLVASKAGGITHDIRGFLRSGLTLIKELATADDSPRLPQQAYLNLSAESLALFDQNERAQKIIKREKLDQVMALLEEAMSMCEPSRSDFLPEAFLSNKINPPLVKTEDLLSVDEKLTLFIENLHKVQLALKNPEILLSLSAYSSHRMTAEKIAILERFLLNLINNAIEASATQIAVTCFSIPSSDQLICEVTDNGSGMEEPLLSTFFKRPMQNHPISSDIEAKRGEGTLIANAALESIGGFAMALKRPDGAAGTYFRLSLPLNSMAFFKPADRNNVTRLNTQQLSTLQNIQRMTDLQGIILLVDDQIINLKLIMKKITDKFSRGFQQSNSQLATKTPTSWQEQSLSFDIVGQFAVICATNGDIAYEVIKNGGVSVLITDQNMPGDRKGTDLIQAIRAMEQDKKGKPMLIALNSSDEISSYEHDFFSIFNVTGIVKGDALAFSKFITQISEGTQETCRCFTSPSLGGV